MCFSQARIKEHFEIVGKRTKCCSLKYYLFKIQKYIIKMYKCAKLKMVIKKASMMIKLSLIMVAYATHVFGTYTRAEDGKTPFQVN